MEKFLHGGMMYISENTTDTYKVGEGVVLVYIVPIINGQNGRRTFLYEASKGEVLPSFNYTDYEGQKWVFGFVALEKAVLQIEQDSITEILKDEFARKANIRSYENEGYEDGLVEQYKLNIVTEDGFIHKTRQEQKQAYENSLYIIYNLFNKRKTEAEAQNGKNSLYDATEYLCKKNHIKIAPIERINESCDRKMTVPDIARLSHFICRKVMLPEDWYKTDSGSLIVFDHKTGTPYACISKNATQYYIYNPINKKRSILTKDKAMNVALDAYMIYRPFTEKEMEIKEIIKFAVQSIKAKDLLLMLVLTLIGSLIGLLTPILNQKLYDTYIPIGTSNTVVQVCCVILACAIGNIAFSVVKSLASFRMQSHIQYDAQSAAYGRLFNLPESFFRGYDSADLAQRVMSVSEFMNSILGILFGTILSGIFSIVYLFRMFGYSSFLSITAVSMLLLYAAIIVFLSLKTIKYSKKGMELSGKTQSVMYQFLNGISKIRIAGIEDRALYEYLKPYTEECELGIQSGKVNIFANTVSLAANSIFSLVLYCCMIYNGLNISMGSFIAFTSAFGSFAGSILQVVNSSLSVCQLKPLYNRLKPIFKTIPESDENMELPGDLSGDIEISNVTFGYDKDNPVLKNLSIHIKEGEYVGIVGPSGCGKSTLLKLLLGFEHPQTGKIYYDHKDIERLDKRELRKKFGVVLQDGKLISGSIYENIVITAPDTDLKRVNETVDDVGLSDDIAMMPMGLHTVVSESSGTISGGQQQRILIARAIVGKPKILFFDEATSALDNVTQALVCESLEKLKSTRVVIAHRLSTVINCDRIIVLDKGTIIEEGSYAELMEQRGYFYKLASRQIA